MATTVNKEPTPRLSLRRNFSWILVGSLIENFAKWAVFVVLAKLVDAEMVGSFSLALAIATPVTILAQLQLRVALITDARDDFPFGAYRALRFVATGLAMLGLALFGLLFYGAGSTGALIALVGASQSVVSLRDIWLGLSQKYERMDVTAGGSMLDGLLSLACFTALLFATRSVHWAVVGMIGAHVITLFAWDRPRTRRLLAPDEAPDQTIAPIWDRVLMKRLFVVVLPLGLTTALVALNSNIPRYFIENWVGREDVGYFSAVFYFVFAASLIVAALGRAASPRLAREYLRDRRGFGRLITKLLAIGTIIGALAVLASWLFGEFFLRVAYTEEYAAQSHILVILMLAGAFRFVGSFLGVGVSAARFFKAQTATNSMIAVATLVSCWLLIPPYGLVGAAWATVVVSAISTLITGGLLIHVYQHAGERSAGSAVATVSPGGAPDPGS